MERFNSWIARRVLNRRYPEATVMETYRIYKLTFFLEMSGRLPGGSIVDVHGDDESMQHPSGDTDSEKLDGDAMANHGYSSHLEPDAVKELDSFYAKLYPEYGHLLSRYIKDKHSAERRDNTQYFPPLSRWIPSDESPLSIIEMSLRKGASDNITQYRMYTTMDKYRRTVRYGSVFAEQSSKVRVSSYIHINSPGHPMDHDIFGRIKFIFLSKFNGNKHVLAYMHWYNRSTTDQETSLKYFHLSSHNRSIPSIVPLTALSKPLIHAIDDNNPDKLWIINS